MIWSNFILVLLSSSLLWLFALLLYKKEFLKRLFIILGTACIGAFIAFLWVKLERPPLRTLGETRLWYAFFLPAIGMITYLRWRFNWMLFYSLGLSLLFLGINYMHPENFSKTLMPALQSPWFVPHVVVYIFAYAFLAASSLVAVRGLYQHYYKTLDKKVMLMADNLVYLGFAFLSLGLLFGALWAKEAWGHYWTWDPKETWALITWLGYLIYIHRRYHMPTVFKSSLWILALAFVILLVCWFGVNYLPSAQFSVHTYSQAP